MEVHPIIDGVICYRPVDSEVAKNFITIVYDLFKPRSESETLFSNKPYSYFNILRQKDPDLIKSYNRNGILLRDDEPGLYIYEIKDGDGLKQTGFSGALRITDDFERELPGHEKIDLKVADKRAKFDRANGVSLESILALTKSTIDPILNEIKVKYTPIYDFNYDLKGYSKIHGNSIKVWKIGIYTKEASKLINAVKEEPLITLDGHHRRKANLINYRLGYQTHSSVHIRSTNAVKLSGFVRFMKIPIEFKDIVSNLRELPETTYLQKTSDLKKPEMQDEICVYTPNENYLWKVKPKYPNDVVRRLNVSIIDDTLIKLLRDMDIPIEIAYEPDLTTIEEIKKLMYSNGYNLGVVLHPESNENVIAVTEAGDELPEKSTCFRLKLPSGLDGLDLIIP